MDVTGTLKNEVFRPVTTTVVPGAIALTPYVFLILAAVPGARAFRKDNPEAVAILVGAAVLAAGLIIEDIGSHIERHFWDGELKRKHPDVDDQWFQYLRLKVQDELVGQRFLRTILLRLKFELSMAPALVVFFVGLTWFNFLFHVLGWREMTTAGIITGGLVFYLVRESHRSAEALWETRREIIAALSPRCGACPE